TQSAITEIEVVDELTVRFHTDQDLGDVIDPVPLGVTIQEILAPEYTASLTPEEFAQAPVGSGPFKFVEWVPDQMVVLEANEDYWMGAPGVEQLIFRTVPEPSTRVAELLAGSVDVIYPVTADDVRALGGSAQIVGTS